MKASSHNRTSTTYDDVPKHDKDGKDGKDVNGKRKQLPDALVPSKKHGSFTDGLTGPAKDLLDMGADKLFSSKGAKGLLAGMQGLYDKGGSTFLKKALNLLEDDLGTNAVNAIDALIKKGGFKALSNDQLLSLGRAFTKVAGLMI